MGDTFDPDRMNADDIDMSDPEAIEAWLDHPNTQALHEDLGRALRAQPADTQRPVLQQSLARDEQLLREVEQSLDAADNPATQAGLQRVRDALTAGIEATRLRLLELDDE